MSEPTWADCYRIARRLARLAGWSGRERDIFPLATWAEIIAGELGVEVPEETMEDLRTKGDA
jgi:hypothetical protein